MKELSIEEKAKAYDNIIKKANKMHCENCEACQMCIEELISELAESEGERIRKELIDYLKERKSCESYGQYVVRYDRWIAWLEKQGEQKSIDPDTLIQQRVDALADIVAEQKPADKVEPKFKVSDGF